MRYESATGGVDLTGPDEATLLSGGRQRKDIGGEMSQIRTALTMAL